MDIEKELQKFDVTDAAIAELKEKYLPLTINGLDDKEGHKAVNAARKVVKGYRIDVDKRRKELNSDALEYQRRINGEARRITELLAPIENHLASEEKKIDDEIERIKREKEQAEAAKFQERVNALMSLGFKFDGIKYATDYFDTFNDELITIATLHVKQWDDSAWKDFIDNAKHYYDRDQEDKAIQRAKEEEERKALIQQRREQEMEREKLADIAHMQAEKEVELKAEEARLAYLKSKEEVMTPCPPTCEAPVHHQIRLPKNPDGSLLTKDEIVTRVDNFESDLNREIEKDSISFWEGFDACLEMVENALDNYDSNELAKLSVYDFIEKFRDDLIEESELYKKDG